MLVLTRKTNESVCIGDDIEVVVLEAHGSRVRLGFRAPQNVSIQRREVADRAARAFDLDKLEFELSFAGSASDLGDCA